MQLLKRIAGAHLSTTFILIDDAARIWQSFDSKHWFRRTVQVDKSDAQTIRSNFIRVSEEDQTFKEVKKQLWRFVSPIGHKQYFGFIDELHL